MSYQVKLIQFTGPLDLLLQLIERSQFEVTGIALADITSQYLSYLSSLEDLQPAELNWFVELASKLMYLKSLALLPSVPGETPDEELEDLTRQLADYGRYQLAARHLDLRLSAGLRSWERPVSTALPPSQLPLPQLQWQALESAFRSAITKLPIKQDVKIMKRPTLSLSAMVQRLRAALKAQSDIKLSRLLAKAQDRHEMVILFLALLELIKAGLVAVNQTRQYDDMMLTAVAA